MPKSEKKNPNFVCPPDMLHGIQTVMDGEYNVPVNFKRPPLIVDIGANIGGFAVWASRRWPGARLVCYEPIPSNFALLKTNVRAFGVKAKLVNAAVMTTGRNTMFLGMNNCGECSFFDLGEQRTDKAVSVKTVTPESVPKCDILKIDTEGSEGLILEGYKHTPIAIMLEYHSEHDADRFRDMIPKRGYRKIEDKPWAVGRGIQKFILASAFPLDKKKAA